MTAAHVEHFCLGCGRLRPITKPFIDIEVENPQYSVLIELQEENPGHPAFGQEKYTLYNLIHRSGWTNTTAHQDNTVVQHNNDKLHEQIRERVKDNNSSKIFQDEIYNKLATIKQHVNNNTWLGPDAIHCYNLLKSLVEVNIHSKEYASAEQEKSINDAADHLLMEHESAANIKRHKQRQIEEPDNDYISSITDLKEVEELLEAQHKRYIELTNTITIQTSKCGDISAHLQTLHTTFEQTAIKLNKQLEEGMDLLNHNKATHNKMYNTMNHIVEHTKQLQQKRIEEQKDKQDATKAAEKKQEQYTKLLESAKLDNIKFDKVKIPKRKYTVDWTEEYQEAGTINPTSEPKDKPMDTDDNKKDNKKVKIEEEALGSKDPSKDQKDHGP